MAKPRVLVTRRWPQAVEARLSEIFDAQLNLGDKPLTPDQFRAAIREYDAILPTVTDKIGAPALECDKPQTRILANYGVGYSHIEARANANCARASGPAGGRRIWSAPRFPARRWGSWAMAASGRKWPAGRITALA